MCEKKMVYKSFLVRIADDGADLKRRITVIRIGQAGEERHFTSLDDLMIFLADELGDRNRPR